MSGLPDIKKLEGREDEGSEGEGKIKAREFFWDSIVLYVLFAIVGLTAIDVVAEFIRGSGVQCFLDGVGLNQSLDDLGLQEYVSDFCSGSVSMGQYFPVFIVIHGSLMAIPHYLWLNHFGGNFDTFFNLASKLVLLRDETSGEYLPTNFVIVDQLSITFGTYKRNWMFRVYWMKLVLQLLFSIVGFVVVIVFFTDFSTSFDCPPTMDDTSDKAWPLPGEQVVCIFKSLRLIELIRIADLILIALVVFCLSWALLWCFATHPSELGSKNIAKFSFITGLPPEMYVQKLDIPCFKSVRRTLQKFFTTVPMLAPQGPRINTDMDFLMMKLFRTDGSFGVTLKEMQILQMIKGLNNDERRRFNLYAMERGFVLTYGSLKKEMVAKELITSDIGWEFQKVHTSFQTIPVKTKMRFPRPLRGMVLGFASRSLRNESAIAVTFGSLSSGYSGALARVFEHVGAVNFNPYYNNPDKPVVVDKTDPSGIMSVMCSIDQLSTEAGQAEFLQEAGVIWSPPRPNPGIRSNFVVVGPIKNELHLTTANVFILLYVLKGYIADNAVLLVMKPLEINGKDVVKEFQMYTPPDTYFTKHHQYADVMGRNEPTPIWPPDQTQFTTVTESPQQYSFNLPVLVDNTDCEFQFSVYKRNTIEASSDPNAQPGQGGSESETTTVTKTKSVGDAKAPEMMESQSGDDVKQKLINLERDVAVELDQY